jgi:CRISPR type III-A-associated RAMP protein Csm4
MTYAVWAPRLQTAFRLLADSGLGGMRSKGFGRARTPDFQPGTLAELLFGCDHNAVDSRAWWLLSLFSPSEADSVEWASGDYSLAQRSGRVASTDGGGAEKLTSRMVAEGSVLVSAHQLRGAMRNVAPGGCPHPVYRAGYALALPIPWPVSA